MDDRAQLHTLNSALLTPFVRRAYKSESIELSQRSTQQIHSGALGQLCGGIVVDHFSPLGLIGGAIALGITSIWIVLATPRRSREYLSD